MRYINNIQTGNSLNDLPIVLNELDHARLAMALKNRLSFLQQNYEIEKNIREFYENFIRNIPNSSISHSIPVFNINNERIDVDQRKYEAKNSANVMQGDNHSNLLEGNTVNIGVSYSDRRERLVQIEALLDALAGDNNFKHTLKVIRHMENVKEELEESENPNESTVSSWLEKSKKLLLTAKKSSEIFAKAKEVYDSFGIAF